MQRLFISPLISNLELALIMNYKCYQDSNLPLKVSFRLERNVIVRQFPCQFKSHFIGDKIHTFTKLQDNIEIRNQS